MNSGPPPLPSSERGLARRSHELDYRVHGDDMQFVEIQLDPEESVIAEAGAMLFLTDGVRMDSVFGDPSAPAQGLLGKLMTAGQRVLTGESLFMTVFTAQSQRRETIAFAAPYPGKIVPMDLRELGGEVLCQKDSFLCAARGVQVGIAFQRRFGAGLFGGEGFILERLRGDGLAFMNAGGMVVQRTLAPGERLRVDTGCVVAFQPSVDYDLEFVGGFRNTLFGGEGLFFASLRGPGEIWLQSLPLSRLAGRIASAVFRRKEEGSLLGGFGNLLDGRE